MPAHDPAIAIPVLASLNIEESERFYVGKLGFCAIYEDAQYLIVRRDQMEIHFWLAEDRIFPENTSCYIRGGQILDLHAELAAKGIERLSEIALKPWGMMEFHLHDPHGNLLRFGAVADEVSG